MAMSKTIHAFQASCIKTSTVAEVPYADQTQTDKQAYVHDKLTITVQIVRHIIRWFQIQPTNSDSFRSHCW
jgi:hypothetical protein